MIEPFFECDFLEWFSDHQEEFTPDIKKRLEWVYIKKANYTNGAKCKVLICKHGHLYVGFLRFCISGKEINLDNIAVEPNFQKSGIGLDLARTAIEEGLKINCTNITLRVSNAAKKLADNLSQKYPHLTFDINYTEES